MKFAMVNLQQLCVIPVGIPAPASDDSPLFTHAWGGGEEYLEAGSKKHTKCYFDFDLKQTWRGMV